MLTKDQRVEPELHWPESYDRTDPSEREPYPGDLSPTRKESFQSITEELERWGATDVRISTASQHYADRPNVPHQYDKPKDVGVAAYYLREDKRADEWHAIACDAWETQRENARLIALYARRQRLAEKCSVTTAQSTHAASALPSGDEKETIAVGDGRGVGIQQEPHEVLGVAPDAPEPVIQGAFRELVKEGHGDQGGNDAYDIQEVKEARDAMLEAIDD